MRSESLRFLKVVLHRRWWIRFAVLTAIFLAWTGVGVSELIFAAVAGALGSTVSFQAPDLKAERFRLGAFLRFVPYFLLISFRGGIDVAKRAFLPSMPIDPAFVHYRLRVSEDGAAAVFFLSTISLVPGTLFVDIDKSQALVHLIDQGSSALGELERLERRVAPIFGESVDDEREGRS